MDFLLRKKLCPFKNFFFKIIIQHLQWHVEGRCLPEDNPYSSFVALICILLDTFLVWWITLLVVR